MCCWFSDEGRFCIRQHLLWWGTYCFFSKKTQGKNLYAIYFLTIRKQISILIKTAAAAKSLQSCPTLCDPVDSSPPGCLVPGILQARTLKWVAISFSNVWRWKVKVKSLIRVRLLATPWTAAYQAPPSMGFSRQEYWSGDSVSSVQSLSRVRLFVTPCTAARQASLSITNSWSLMKLMPIELVMPSSHLILCRPLLLLPPIPPSLRVFSNESTLGMRWPIKYK